jgi:hypothetical protein
MRPTALALVFLLAFRADAQTFPVSTVMKNGDDTNRINFVILPDGYTSGQLSGFGTNAADLNNYLFNITPYKEYKQFFNCYRVDVPSIESGATHAATATDVVEPIFPAATVNTVFGCQFDVGGIHRLLSPSNYPAIYGALNTNVPAWDQAVILVNTPFYGGAGGTFATASLNASSHEIAVHELGHSFADLADEYYHYGHEAPNMTAQSNPSLVKWKNWVGTNGIGVFPYGSFPPSSNWYKPHSNCKMATLGPPFCSVCQETTINKIYSLVTPIDKAVPDTSSKISFTTSPLKFKLQIVRPDPNTIKVEWLLNGLPLNSAVDSVLLTFMQLQKGDNFLTALVTDTTSLSRSYWPAAGYQFPVNWKLHRDSSLSISEAMEGGKIRYKLFPVPAKDKLIFECDNSTGERQLTCNILSVDGKLIKRMPVQIVSGRQATELDISTLPSGNYLLRFEGSSIRFDAKIVKE